MRASGGRRLCALQVRRKRYNIQHMSVSEIEGTNRPRNPKAACGVPSEARPERDASTYGAKRPSTPHVNI